jgi:hypothetical protein
MIVFYKRSLGDGTYVIRFNIASFKERREVSVFSREKRLGQWLIEPGKTQEIFIEKIVLNQGLNTLSLEVSPGMQENEAGRKVSVAVSDFQIME